jgi:hypothetical protein
MAFQLPVGIETRQIKHNQVSILYPQITGPSPAATRQINSAIINQVNALIKEQGKFLTSNQFEMIGHYELKTNERGILSLTLSNYAMSTPSAHGMTFLKGLTFDVNTGKQYQLSDLFKPGAPYVSVLSREVQIQIQLRQLPVLSPFSAIAPNQDYCLADKTLVLFYQLYELVPYYYGFPMFPISNYTLLSLVPDQSPISILAVDSE